MKRIISKGQLSIFIVLAILILDQTVKILVKKNMHYGESMHITDWFYIHFVENNGMAFGIKVMPKIIQTISRLVFVSLIMWYIALIIKHDYKLGFIVSLSLILAGAWGNIIDSIFYGTIFSESTPYHVASFVPIGDGYSSWMHGQVVDMFYFPFFEFNWPGWIPHLGGNSFTFFGAVFNIADASITCGIAILFFFYLQELHKSLALISNDTTSKLKLN